MARTTRATRQQRDVEGTEASPLVSLDDQPRRQKEAKTKVKEDSSKSSKKAYREEAAEEAPKKAKSGSKKAAQDGGAEDKPAKAKHTSKKASQEEPVEEASVQVKSTAKKTKESETAEKTPAKTKRSSKKTQESQSTAKSPVKEKNGKKGQQEEVVGEPPAKAKTSRTKKAASGDKSAKAAHTEHSAKSAQTANENAGNAASSEQSNAVAPTSPVKAARARARSLTKETPRDPNGTNASELEEQTSAKNPTSPVKAALARAHSPAKETPAETNNTNTAAFDEEPTAENPTSPVKAARRRARSPAKSSPTKQPATQSRQEDTPADNQSKSTTLDTFPFALPSSFSPSFYPFAKSRSPLHQQGIKTESALDDSPCPTQWLPAWNGIPRALEPDPSVRSSFEVPYQSGYDYAGLSSSPTSIGPPAPIFGKPSVHWSIDGVPRSPTDLIGSHNWPSGQSSLLCSSFDTLDYVPVKSVVPTTTLSPKVKFVLTTPGGTTTSLSPPSESRAAGPSLDFGVPQVLGTLLSKHKAIDPETSSPVLLPQPQPLKQTSVAKSSTTVNIQSGPNVGKKRLLQESNEPLRSPSLSKDPLAPVTTGRLQRQLNRKARVFMKFWMEPGTFATPREWELQGTYRIPKTAFLHFFLALRPDQKILTEIASPKPQTSAKLSSAQVSPQKASSNDSTPSKRKLELPAPNDEQPSPSKRLRTEPKPRKPHTRSPAKPNGVRVPTKSPVKPKRYAKQGGYDRNGNLVFPGQELFDSTDEEITKAPPVLQSPPSPLAAIKAPAKTQYAGPRSPTKLSRHNRDAAGPWSPSKSSIARQDEALLPHNDFNLPATPAQTKQMSIPPATAPNLRTPGRRWNLAGRVTASIGKLNPFSFFTRSAQPLAAQPAAMPEIEPVIEPVFVPVNEASNAHAHLTSAPDVMEVEPIPPSDQQALTVIDDTDPQSEISDLLLSVLQQRCPEIADEKLVSTVQASFTQSEGLARHKAEEAQERLNSITDPVTRRLLVLLERQYPDLSSVGILAKLDELIDQQQIVASFKQQQARKHHMLVSEENRAKKRKRPTSPKVIPNPVGKSYGMDLDFFGSSSDSDEGDDEPEVESERPSKMPRLETEATPPRLIYSRRQPGSEPAAAAKKRAQVHFQSYSAIKPKDDPKRASPYTGTIFRDSHEAPGNIFAAASSHESATMDRSVGHFEVPLSSSDSDDSDNELPATPSKSGTSTHAKNTSGGGSILKGSPLNAAAKAAKEAAAKEPAAKESPPKSGAPQEAGKDSRTAPSPPPAPTPAHAALPAAPASQGQHDPVALARAQANKYAPKTSSKLKSVSRLSNSPAMKSAGHPLAAGRNGTKRNANIKLVSVLDDYDLDPNIRAAFEEWDHKPVVGWSSYELDPAVSEAFATWDTLEIDPIATYELDPEAAAFLNSIEYD